MNDSNLPNENLHDSTLSSLYQQSKLDEPSMAIDSAIMQQARKAVEKKSKRNFLNLSWLIPAASTAMILLAVTITYQNRNSALVEEKPMTVMSDSTHLERRSMAKQEAPSPETSPEPEAFEDNAIENESLAETKAASAPMEMKKSKRMAAPTITQMDEVAVNESQLGMAADMESEMKADIAEPVLQAAPQAISRSKEQAETEHFTAKAMAKRQALSMPEITATDEVHHEPRDPKVWIKEIEELLSQGKEDEAREEFKAFRKQFPDYKVEKKLENKLTLKEKL